jgi:hypothetical protein
MGEGGGGGQRSGPQRPGYGFTSGGGSAPIGQGGQGSTSTPQGPSRPSSGGGSSSSSRSSGGGSSTPLVSSSSSVTGVDTGTQAIATSSTSASNVLLSGLNKTTPTAGQILTSGLKSGGGSSQELIQGPVRPGESSVSGVSISNRPGGGTMLVTPKATNWDTLGGTRTDIGKVDLYPTVTTGGTGSKISDVLSGLGVVTGLGGTSTATGRGLTFIKGGATGELQVSSYWDKASTIQEDYLNAGALLNPIGTSTVLYLSLPSSK